MNNILEILEKFFTIESIAGYAGGVFTALMYIWVKDRQGHTDRIHKMRLMTVAWALFILWTGWLSISSEKNAICIGEFQDNLSVRSKLNDQADALSDERDRAATHWLLEVQSPPPQIAELSIDDPIRQTWFRNIAKDYNGHIQQIQDKRRDALKERAAHALPESRCGKS